MSGTGDQATPSPTATENSVERSYAHCSRDIPTRRARHPEGKPVIRSATFTPTTGWISTRWIVASPSERDALTYTADATGVGAVREFIDDTDLSEHSLLVYQYNYDHCAPLEVERVLWGDSADGAYDIAIEFADEKQQTDEPCEKATLTTVLRLPAVIEEIKGLDSATFSFAHGEC